MWKHKKLSLVITTIMVLSAISFITTTLNKAEASNGAILYVGGSGPGNYTSIQSAIDDANDGDTVFVYNGTYYENVIINKTINLLGDDRNTTIIDGMETEDVVYLSADMINISGFTIQNCGRYFYHNGIRILSNYNNISGNTITNNSDGIYLSESNGNTITGNTITKNNQGIYLFESNGNTITGNTITNNTRTGINLVHYSNGNTITGNTITNNHDGIYLSSSNSNTITGNTFFHNGLSVAFSFQNTVINNTVNGKPLVYLEGQSNINIDNVNEAGQLILVNCINITIKNQELINTTIGIKLWDTDNCLITGNTITNNTCNIITNSNYRGIDLYDSNNNTITGNTITNNNDGIYLSESNGNTITGNTITNNTWTGINLIYNSNGNTITGNTFFHNGLYVHASRQNTVTNNTVNGKPLVYLEGKSNIIIDNVNEAGQLILVTCTGITIKNQELINTTVGIELWDTDNCLITGNTITHNPYGGIDLHYSKSNTIMGNTITNNTRTGIDLAYSNNNLLYHNNLISNTQNANDECSNYWNNSYPSGGNYWSDYTGTDLHHGKNQDITGSDGIGDVPYTISGNNNTDRYPLMEPSIVEPPPPPPPPPQKQAFLEITSSDIVFTETNPHIYEEIQITVTIHNIGNETAENITVKFYDVNTLIGQCNISHISHNSYGIAAIPYIPQQEGIHPIQVVAQGTDTNTAIATRSLLIGHFFGGIDTTLSVLPNPCYPAQRIQVSGLATYNTTYGWGSPVAGAKVTVSIQGLTQAWTGHTLNDGTYHIPINAPTHIGTYTIIVHITDNTFSQKSTSTLTVEMVEGIDLIVTSLTLSTTKPLLNEQVTMTATISNMGTEPATEVHTQFYDEKKLIGSTIPNQLDPQESIQVSIDWTASPVGKHTIDVIIDPKNNIDEYNENNNDLSSLKHLYVYPLQPDLTPAHIQFSDFAPCENQDITIYTEIKNIGGVSAPSVLVYVYDDNLLIGQKTIMVGGKSGSTRLSVPYQFTTNGTHKIKIVVDPQNTIPEYREDNNIYWRYITVHPPTPDLTLTSLECIPVHPMENEMVTLSVIVKNIGEREAHNFPVLFTENNGKIGRIYVSYLAKDSSKKITISWIATPNGWHTLEAFVDPGYTVPELSELNNKRRGKIYVGPITDILVENIVFSDTNPDINDIVIIQAIIFNTGEISAKNVTVTIDINNIRVSSGIITPSLPPGSRITSQITYIPTRGGWHKVRVATYPGVHDPPDAYPQDNVMSKWLNVKSPPGETKPLQPDLRIYSGNISFFPEYPEEGENVNISFEISNIGEGNAFNVTLTLSVDEKIYGMLFISQIPSGITSVHSISWMAEGRGSHVVRATAYPGREDTQDRDPSDNEASRGLIVSGPPFIPTVHIDNPVEDQIMSGYIFIQGTSGDIDGLIENVQIKIDTTEWILANGTVFWEYSWNTLFVQDGLHSISARSYDGHYNSSIEALSISIDNTPPETNPVLIGNKGYNDWYTSEVSITLDAIDAGSTVEYTKYKINTGPYQEYTGMFSITNEGFTNITYYSIDTQGHNETPKTIFVKIDMTSPETSVILNPGLPNGNNDWYTGSVTVGLNPYDTLSQVNETLYRINEGNWQIYTEPFTLAYDGNFNIDYYSLDKAGNQENGSSVQVKIDSTKPILNLARPQRNTFYMFDRELFSIPFGTIIIGKITMEVSSQDQTSGIDKVQFIVDDEIKYVDSTYPHEWVYDEKSLLFNRHTIGIKAIDKAGNTMETDDMKIWLFNL